MARHVRFLFTGSLGDSLISGKFGRDLLTIYDETTLAQKLFHKRKRVFSEAEQADLFSDEFRHQVQQGHIFDVYRRSLGRVKAPMATSKRLYHSIRQANRRWILEGQRLLRSQVEVRLPFYDNDLVDFMLTVPPGWLLEGYLYNQAINQASPTLAKIPYDATGLPLVPCMRDVAIRADRQLRWRLREIGLKWVPEIERKPYTDYNGWMRTALRPWVQETLLSPRALERGYFKPEQVRNVVAEHMAGTDHARKLGVLLTFELWHKLFLD